MKKIFLIIWILIGQAIYAQVPNDILAGQWTFDDPNNLNIATVGNDLVLIGSHSIVTGPDSVNGAVNIGTGSYYMADHSITPKSGESYINEFTIVMDVKVSGLGKWYSLYQTSLSNSNDTDWAISPDGELGIGATGYSNSIIKPGEWYRLAISVKNGSWYDYYFDGQLLFQGTPQSIDGRFSLGSIVLFFADDNGEDSPIDVAELLLFSRALDVNEIKTMGGYGHKVREPINLPIHTYLQSPTPTSIYICWHANDRTESIVEFGTTEAFGNTKTGESHVFNSQLIWHWVHLTDLTQETVYYYRAITDTDESEIKKFKTPPPNESKHGHVRFAVHGDTRTDINSYSWVIDNMKSKMIELYGEDIESNINCLLNTGDIVTSGYSLNQYKYEYFNPIEPISGNVPFMVSIGNHENEAPDYYHYMKYEDIGGPQGEKYYSFRIGRVLFIALNSNWQLRNDTQIVWLNGLLHDTEEDTTIDWIFAFCHHPGHSEMWVDGNTPYVQDKIIPTLKKYGKVDMLMYGHTHAYERGAVTEGNLRLMESGGGGANLDRWGEYYQLDYPEIQKAFDHYCYSIIDIDIANKIYSATTYSLGHPEKYLDNVIIDRFYRDKADTTKLQRPDIVSPQPGTKIEAPIVLKATPYPEIDDLMSSQFQVTTTEGDYSTPLLDENRNFEDIYGDTGPPNWESIDLNEGINLSKYNVPKVLLSTDTQYWWRVRYRDKNLQWSNWSKESSFTFESPSHVTEGSGTKIRTNRLYANYPNPFNSSSTIRFDLQKRENVKLIIYDIRGKIIKELINTTKLAGEHSISWDGKDIADNAVPSGVYYYQIVSNSFVDVGKAILLK